MSNWKEKLYLKANVKNFEIAVSNIPDLIQEFSFKFEELVKPMRLNFNNININNTFDIKRESELYEGSFVPEFTIQDTTLSVQVNFEHKLVSFISNERKLLIVRIDSVTGARIVGEIMDRPLMEHDFNVLLENAFSNSIE